MSSRMILAARSRHVGEEHLAQASEAPFSASASWSFSTARSRVWTPPGSSLPRSSKTNIRARMRSAASRLRSSRAVMKRASVWRSKVLKMSAIISWLSRLGARQVRHELGAQGLLDLVEDLALHRLHAQHAHHAFQREVLGQRRQHARGVLGLDLGQHHRDGLRVFVLQVVGEHRLVHVAELVPHGAAGRTADLLHDRFRPVRSP